MSKLELQRGGDTKLCALPIPDTETPPFEPTWEKFCASMSDSTGRVVPNQNDPRWRSYFNLWAIGYVAALRCVLKFSSNEKPKPTTAKLP